MNGNTRMDFGWRRGDDHHRQRAVSWPHAVSNDDIDTAFIREFQVHGNDLNRSLSRDVRMERIRASIFQYQRASERFFDTDMNYLEAFHLRFGKSAERRLKPREAHPKADEVILSLFSDDDDL